MPESLRLRLSDAIEDRKPIPDEFAQRLTKLENDLGAKAEEILRAVKNTTEKPSFIAFDALSVLFEEFTHNIRRLQQDLLRENSGLDPMTGLRNTASLDVDLHREMERLARQGRPFSLALVRIDNLDAITEQAGVPRAEQVIRNVADMIRKSLRSFDDAYRITDNEFILSLKQADIRGGLRALERLRLELERKSIVYDEKGNRTNPMTLSCCVAEPVPGEHTRDLIENLRADLHGADKSENIILEYHEMSPLQRFIKTSQT
jgi:diguanylate cyclase (GGDEF)-like protein